MTSPARSDTTVTGTVVPNPPRNNPMESAMIEAIATTIARPARGRTAELDIDVLS
jgi:hypothetical protein